MGSRLIHLVILTALVASPPASSQEEPAPDRSDAASATPAETADRPPHPTIVATPAMARSLARMWVNELFVQRYKLEPKHHDEVIEKVARELMAFAHELDTPEGTALVRSTLDGIMQMRAHTRGPAARPEISPETARYLGQHLPPMIPRLRELFANVVKDVRPRLATGQQLRLAGDMMLVNSALDFMDESMQRWARGDIKPDENPIDPYMGDMRYEGYEKMQERWKSEYARSWAERNVPDGQWKEWTEYVKQAAELYEFDATQSAAAESILRECMERGNDLLAAPAQRDRLFQAHLWHIMSLLKRRGTLDDPSHWFLQRQLEETEEPWKELGGEMRRRVDEIATEPQRRAASERMYALFAEQGYEPNAVEETEGP